MPSSETSSALSGIGLRRYPAKFSDYQASTKGGIYRFWGAELPFGRTFVGEVGPFGSRFFDFGTDLLVLLQLKQLRGGR
jgi:hypothetical protein